MIKNWPKGKGNLQLGNEVPQKPLNTPKSQPLNHMPYRRPTLIIKASYTTEKDQDQVTEKCSRAILLV